MIIIETRINAVKTIFTKKYDYKENETEHNHYSNIRFSEFW